MPAETIKEVRERERARRFRIIVMIGTAAAVASFLYDAWADRALDDDVRDARTAIDEYFGEDASEWHAVVAGYLYAGPHFEFDDRPRELNEVLRIVDTVGGQVALERGRDVPASDVRVHYRIMSFGRERCLTVVVEAAGSHAIDEADC